MIIQTNEHEKAITEGTSYLQCFQGVNLRRTEIACVAWSVQILCGSSLMGYSTYFYEQAGLSASIAYSFTLGQYGLGVLGTLAAWWTMRLCGRRTLYLYGLYGLNLLLLLIGLISLAPSKLKGPKFAMGSVLMVYIFIYDMTVGPVTYAIVSEVSATRLRAKSVVIARNAYNITGIINNIISPRMLNPAAWNWGPKSAFFWFGICSLCIMWTFWRLPESKNRTYQDLDILFERRVSARKFRSTVVQSARVETKEKEDCQAEHLDPP